MLFTFPGTILTKDLETELAPFFALVQTELQHVTCLQISFLGWRGTSRCQIRDQDNLISDMVFDPSSEQGEHGIAQVRKLRPGAQICDRPDELVWSPLAAFFNHDD
jgi:hypothetical protein